jgi:hypothetical protein
MILWYQIVRVMFVNGESDMGIMVCAFGKALKNKHETELGNC